MRRGRRCGFAISLAAACVGLVMIGTGLVEAGTVDARQVYLQVADEHGIEVSFDLHFKSDEIAVGRLDGQSPEAALESIARAGGHFIVELEDGGYLVANDTPQKRREYEPLGIQVFALEHASVREVDKLLRSLIEARRLSTDERLATVSLRDTTAKLCVARRLIEVADQPAAQVGLAVSLLDAPAEAELPATLGAEAAADLVDSGAIRWTGGLSVVGSGTSRVAARIDNGGFALEVRARTHPSSDRVTLELDAQGDVLLTGADGAVERRDGRIASSARLATGEAVLLRLPDPGSGLRRLLVVSPAAIEPTRFTPEQLELLRVGTESRIDFECDR